MEIETYNLKEKDILKYKKAQNFTVNSDNGSVSVLGTQFNVKTNPSYFEVLCYEGKVQVKNTQETAILTKGLSFRKIENNNSEKGTFSNSKPTWLDGDKHF